MIGPLGVEATETFMVDNQSYGIMSQNYHRSRSTKLCLPLESSAEKEITAGTCVQVRSYQSANRFLSTIEREEILKVAYKENYFQRRPEMYLCGKKK